MSRVQTKRKASTSIGEVEAGAGTERGWIVWALWTASYAVGGTVGSLASAWFTDLFFPGGGAALGLSVPFPQLAVGILGTLVFGSVLGLANWLVVRLYMKGMAVWPILTGLGLTLGSLVALMAIPSIWSLPVDDNNAQQVSLLGDSINSTIIGLLIGIAQAALLTRRVSDRASIATFVFTSALGWLGLSLLASLLISATAGMSDLGPALQLGILLISFALAGAISGIEIPTLLKRPRKAEPEPAKEATPDDNPAAAGAD